MLDGLALDPEFQLPFSYLVNRFFVAEPAVFQALVLPGLESHRRLAIELGRLSTVFDPSFQQGSLSGQLARPLGGLKEAVLDLVLLPGLLESFPQSLLG